MSVRNGARVVFALCVVAVVLPTSSATANPARRPPERVAGRYIVGFTKSVARPGRLADDLEAAQGFRTSHRYRHALEGFAASLSPAQVEKLRRHPKVAFVSPDYEVHALGTVELAPGDSAPTGIRRIDAASTTHVHEASSVNVAVLDTGIDLAHPDLNAVAGKTCNGTGPPSDGNGHGTHVAGTIAAKNDGGRVVGVAPGTAVYAVKVLSNSGSGSWSNVICGIDWATSTRTDADPSNDIAVANMSLGGLGSTVKSCATTTDPLHKAICTSSAAGVTYVVAAGNSGWDFDYPSQPDVPAAYPEVLTVTAASDSDGLPGGTGGAPTCRSGESDDRYASFSNYALTSAGRAHTVAGPGVCILSDWPGGGTRTISGTSMATPHLAGAVALCLEEAGSPGPCAGMSPAQIIQKVRADAEAHTTATSSYGFAGDPLRPAGSRYFGYLAHVGMPSVGGTPPPPPQPVSASPAAVTIETGTLRSGNAGRLVADDDAYYQVNSTTSGTRTTSWYGTFSGVPGSLGDLTVAYKGKNSRSCTQTVDIRRWTTGSWIQLDSRKVGTSEVLVERKPGGTLSDYVSGSGQVRVRVRCTLNKSFFASGDLMRIAYVAP